VGIYSARGSAAFDRRVEEQLGRVIESVCRLCPDLAALILVGGYARGEGTPLHLSESETPFNDYDLIVVTRGWLQGRRHGLRRRIDLLAEKLTVELGIAVDLHVESVSHLRRLPPTLFNIEAIHGHRVLWGDRDIMKCAPAHPIEAVPRVEAARLLLNRGALLLHQKYAYRYFGHRDDPRFRTGKFVLKAHLAMGDALLIAASRYDVHYSVKRRRIVEPFGVDSPELTWIREHYLAAIETKESGKPQSLEKLEEEPSIIATRRVFARFVAQFEHQCLTDPAQTVRPVLRTAPRDLTSAAKSLVRTASLLKLRMIDAGLGWIIRPTEERLLTSLPPLLSDETDASRLRVASRLLGTSTDIETMSRRFLWLWERLV